MPLWRPRWSPFWRTPRFSSSFRGIRMRKCLLRSYRRVQSSDDNIQKLRPGGAVAQLGARLDGIEEVVGSNPIGSTIFKVLSEKTANCYQLLLPALLFPLAFKHESFTLCEETRCSPA